MGEREALLRERRAEVAAGWGDKYVARVHEKGKLTTRERLTRLADPDTRLFEVGTFVNYGLKFGDRGPPPCARSRVSIMTATCERRCSRQTASRF